MEDFIDYILIILLLFVIAFSSLLIFLLLKNPRIGYWLLYSFLGVLIGGIGIVGWRMYQKKRLGTYYELIQELSRAQKEIYHSTTRLERYSKKALRGQYPKIRQLCREAQKRLHKIIEIDKTLVSFEKKGELADLRDMPGYNKQTVEKLRASYERYQQNIRKIEASKHQYLQDVQEVVRFLHELNSQILALKYSTEKQEIQSKIAETIDELLIDIQTLEELT